MSKPRRLSKNDERLLWSLSGGYCAFQGCTQVLVFEDARKTVSLGDVAHVIAHSEGGPRGSERTFRELDEEWIDSYENTILLCKNHHSQVDQNPDAYPPELLYQWKREREDRIRNLRDRKNAVCLVHKIKGPPMDVIKAAEDLNLSFVGLVSLQESIDDQSAIDWDWARDINVKKYEELMELRTDHAGEVISILALSPIPMLIHLGSLITDTIPAEILQYDRDRGLWVRNCTDLSRRDEVKLEKAFYPGEGTVLAVSFAVTGAIDRGDIAGVLSTDYDLLELRLPTVGTNRVLYRDDVLSCKRQFRDNVEVSLRAKAYQDIHLFYAGPAGLAVEIGRCINVNTWPPVHTYDYQRRGTPRYQLAITL